MAPSIRLKLALYLANISGTVLSIRNGVTLAKAGQKYGSCSLPFQVPRYLSAFLQVQVRPQLQFGLGRAEVVVLVQMRLPDLFPLSAEQIPQMCPCK